MGGPETVTRAVGEGDGGILPGEAAEASNNDPVGAPPSAVPAAVLVSSPAEWDTSRELTPLETLEVHLSTSP